MSERNIDLLRSQVNGFREDDVPFEVVPLPSKGLIYGEEHPLCDEKEVEIKPMTAVQENILASKALIKNGTVMSVLMKSCFTNTSIDPTSLLIGDKSAILLGIRISGFGADYRVQTRCPACNEEFLHTFDLSKCEMKPLEEQPVRPHTNLFEFALPKSKKIVQFSLLTDADDLEIMQTQRNRSKTLNTEIDMRITDELTKMIKSVDGKEDREFIAKFVRSMSVMDSRAFRKHVVSIQPGVDLEEEVTCRKCGAVETHNIPLTTEFFWPSLE